MNCLAYASPPPPRPTHHRRKVLAVSKLELSLKHFFTWTKQDFCIKKNYCHSAVCNEWLWACCSFRRKANETIFLIYHQCGKYWGEVVLSWIFSSVFCLSGHIMNRDKQLLEADQDGEYWSSSKFTPHLFCFTDGEIEGQKEKVTCRRSQRG